MQALCVIALAGAYLGLMVIVGDFNKKLGRRK